MFPEPLEEELPPLGLLDGWAEAGLGFWMLTLPLGLLAADDAAALLGAGAGDGL